MLEAARQKDTQIITDGEKQYAALRARYQATYKQWQQLKESVQSLEETKTCEKSEDTAHGTEI